MANIRYAFYKRFNGTDWDTIYFKAPASAISEVTDKRFLTDEQQTNVNNYLFSFNAANKLLKLDGSAKIPSAQLPFNIDDYYKKTGGTITGSVILNPADSVASLTFKSKTHILGSDSLLTLSIDGKEYWFDKTRLHVPLGNIITGLGSPSNASDATNKAYVDGLVSKGTRPVEAVQATWLENITPQQRTGEKTIDSYHLSIGDRVLLTGQTNNTENGIYEVTASEWVKINADSTQGSLVFVEHGDFFNDSAWYCEDGNNWFKYSQVDIFEFDSYFSKSGNVISLANNKLENKHIKEGAGIELSKLASFIPVDDMPWDSLSLDSANVQENIDRLFSAITSLRGTENYNTNNDETVKGAYTLANSKNRTYEGSSAPSNSGYVTGDVYIHYEVPQP